MATDLDPNQWLKRLTDRLSEQRNKLSKWDAYYEGMQPLSYLAPELIVEMGDRLRPVVVIQHVKLGAVLDMADLHDPADARLFEAPWREDPRPLEGLLQGTYAHVGVTDFWRVRRSTAPDAAERGHAAAEFARWLGHTVRSCDTLAGSGSLTPLGLRFTEAMRATLEPWLAESPQVAAL